MKTNFHMLREFEYNPENFGWCTEKEVENIVKHFQLKERSDVELQNLRDFVVMYYADQIEAARPKGIRGYVMELQDTMSAITGVIDQEKFERGMEI